MSEEKRTASIEADVEEINEEKTRRLSPLVDFQSVLSKISATDEKEPGEKAEADLEEELEVDLEELPEADLEELSEDELEELSEDELEELSEDELEELSEDELEADESEPEQEAAEVGDEASWYVIHCYSGYENKVKHNLEQRIETMQMQDQIFAVEVPTEDEIEVREGKRRTVQRRIFPGYILVQMNMNDDSWYVVRNTPGVTGFVGMGNKPTALRPEEVQGIMHRMEAEAPKIKVTFRPGQKVRIIDGPFNDFMGVVDEIDIDRAKVRVFVSFFGRETPVELDFLQVEKM